MASARSFLCLNAYYFALRFQSPSYLIRMQKLQQNSAESDKVRPQVYWAQDWPPSDPEGTLGPLWFVAAPFS